MSSDKDFKTVMENVIETNILYEENMAKNYFSTANNLPRNSENHKTLGNNNWFEKVSVEHTPVQEFYRGANVLVTGATGFIGKVLVEKLLRSCPDVNSIYLLVRSKRGKDVEERIEDLIASPCFDRLKTERPEFKNKLIAVAGDISNEGLGISDQDRQLLAKEVNIVFHVAATVKFDEQLNVAIKQNVRGTRDLLLLCKTFTNLKSMVHVSTAFSYCPFSHIEEKFYDPPMSCDKAIQLAEIVEERSMKTIQKRILGEWPNTYSFTKAVAEDAVNKYGQGMPVGVLRPSVVICTKREPIIGWTEKLDGTNGIFAGIFSGVLHTAPGDYNKNGNCVPCDMLVNALIAAAWDIAVNKRMKVPVFNFVSTGSNETNLNQFINNHLSEMLKHPYSGAIWYPFFSSTNSQLELVIKRILLHYLPAAFIDGWAVITGNNPKMIKRIETIHHFTDVLAYFCKRSWTFEEEGISNLWAKLSPKDKELFPCDMTTLVWDDFFKNTSIGLRQHILKDGDETLPQARSRMRKLMVVHGALCGTLILIPTCILLKSKI